MTVSETLLVALNKTCWTTREKLRQAIIEHLIDTDVQSFCEMGRTDMADAYEDKIRNGCVGYEKMTDEQLSKDVEDSCDFETADDVKEYFELD
jgi:hypothetical protein